MSKKVWYGDVAGRKCSDCGERCDWDERLRRGYVAQGGATHPDGITPLYDPLRHYGDTEQGRAEQAKLEAHYERFHRGGLRHRERRGAWLLEVHRYSADLARSRAFLLRRRPFYAILTTQAPNGASVSTILDGYRTIDEAIAAALGG